MVEFCTTIQSSGSMVYLVFITLSAAVSSVSGTCPNNAIQKAMSCTARLGKGPPAGSEPGAFIDIQDTEKLIYACGNGDLFSAVNCIERVVHECKNDNTDPAHFLRNMIDIEKTRSSIKYFCTNIAVYAANSACIRRHHKDQVACAADAKSTYQTQMTATANMDVLMRFQCQFYHSAVDCAEKILKEYCSTEVGDIVKTVLEGLNPPNCASKSVKAERTGSYDIEDDDGNENASVQFTLSIPILILSYCLLLML